MIDDDWKGEHLIRAPRKRIEHPPKVCKVEGCTKALDNRNVTGVCQKHRQYGRSYKRRNS